MQRQRFVLRLCLAVGVIVALVAVAFRVVAPRTICLQLDGPPGLVVRGYVEADGRRQDVTALPFQFEGRVRRISYLVAPMGEQPGLSVRVHSGDRCIMANGSGPGAPALRGWLRHDLFVPGAAWQESFDPKSDDGWSVAPE